MPFNERKDLVTHGQGHFHWKTRFFVSSDYEAPSLLRMTSFHHDHVDSVLVCHLHEDSATTCDLGPVRIDGKGFGTTMTIGMLDNLTARLEHCCGNGS